MKRNQTLLLSSLLSLMLLASCSGDTTPPAETVETPPATTEVAPENGENTENGEETPAETVETADPVDVTVLAMKGPTAMGMVSMMADAENITSNNFVFSIITAIDEVTAQLLKGDADIAAVPANVASVLYQNTEGQVQVLAINTLGVLYLVENGEEINDISDLEGKTIYASGKGATPEYALNYILAENGLSDSVTIEWKSEQSEVVALLAKDENALAMLPQPFVTTAQMSQENLRIALDLTEEWDNTGSEGRLITGVVVANADFVENNPYAVEDFLNHYEASVQFMTENTEEGAQLVGENEIVTQEVALLALPYCGLTFIDDIDMKTGLTGYLQELFDQNPASIGGAMPEDDFFYGRS